MNHSLCCCGCGIQVAFREHLQLSALGDVERGDPIPATCQQGRWKPVLIKACFASASKQSLVSGSRGRLIGGMNTYIRVAPTLHRELDSGAVTSINSTGNIY